MIDLDRAAKRYAQIRGIEIEVGELEEKIKDVNGHRLEVEEQLNELRERKKGLLLEMRSAARDEGQLPLLPFDQVPARTDGPVDRATKEAEQRGIALFGEPKGNKKSKPS